MSDVAGRRSPGSKALPAGARVAPARGRVAVARGRVALVRGHLALGAALAAAVSLAVAACSTSGATFAPTGPCTTDGRAAGAYPALEALVPRSLGTRAATTIDSGRNCSDDALGSLISHGVHELRFAGSTWDEGGGNGESIAILALPDAALPVAWAEEFYDIGAQTAKHTENIETSRPTYPGAGSVYRLDTLNDLSFQSIVVWQAGPAVRVVIVASPVNPSASKADHDARVDEAVAAAITAPAPTGTAPPPASLVPYLSSPDAVLPSGS
jgi:hypothetical protein